MTQRMPPPVRRRRGRSGLALLLAGLGALVLLMVSLPTWWIVREDRALTLASEARNGLVAVRLLDEHARQVLGEATRQLDRVAAAVRASGQPGEREILRLIAAQNLVQNQQLKALQFVSEQGISWVSSPDYPTHQMDVGTQPHVRYLLDHPEHSEVLIGRAYASPYDSQLVVPLARNLFDAQERHLGLVSVDIRISYFGELYAQVAKDNNAAVALLSTQGHVIVRSPFEARYFDRDLSSSPVMTILTSAPDEGVFIDGSFLDDESARQYVFRRIAGHGIITLYGREVDEILAPWRQRTRDRVLFAAGGVAVVFVLLAMLASYFVRLRRTQQDLVASQERFAGLFQHSPVPLVLLELPEVRMVELNNACVELLGRRRDEILAHPVADTGVWLELDQRARLAAQLLRDGRVPATDVRLRHRDGSLLTASLSASEFSDRDRRLAVVTLIDVTRQRQIEQEIRELNLRLEQRVAARTESLERANHELNQALASIKSMQAELIRSEKMSALGSLVAGVAHELNTPIGIGVTVASTLQDHVNSLLGELDQGQLRRSTLSKQLQGFRGGVDILMRNLDRAANLISSFKQVAVDQSGDLRRRFNLRATLEEMAVTLEPLCRKSSHRLLIEAMPDIEMDSFPGALAQIVTNLVNNSLMHGFEGRHEGLMRIGAEPVGPGSVRLCYTDNGLGIPQEHLARIFDPFFTTKLGHGGSGLGMHIVFNLVRDRLGGRIEVASAPDEGVRITLTLPRVAPQRGNTGT